MYRIKIQIGDKSMGFQTKLWTVGLHVKCVWAFTLNNYSFHTDTQVYTINQLQLFDQKKNQQQ